MEKRLITAIALSILLIIAFQYFAVKPVPPSGVPIQKEVVGTAPAVVTPIAEAPSLPEEKELEAVTDKYLITFSNVGGSIKNLKLKDYKTLNSKEPLELVHITNPKEYLCNISDNVSGQIFDLVGYSQKADGLTVTYTLITKEYEVIKKYTLRNSNYGIELAISIRNLSAKAKEISYDIIGGSGLTEKNEQDLRLIEAAANVNGKTTNLKRPRRGERTITLGMVGWEALKNKYFSIILKPFVQTRGSYAYEDSVGNLIVGLDTDKTTIQPGDSVEHKYSLYAGPSDIAVLKEFGYGVEESVNYGMFGWISKGLIAVLKLCNMLVRNWGLSIIILSILLNILLFPLTMNSFKSMQKMQELHPQMEKLKTQFKDQPQKLNKEIMGLYKKYNINPFSGCLPILLQMPIFIALYQALMKSIDLRGASFLWIRDLSSPEAVPLPISLPIIGDSINILPLIMVAAMVLQQKISTKSAGAAVSEEQKQQQKIMLIIMPIMFGFIFYNMPSGLVLYWVVNTVLTIGEQSAVLQKDA